MFAKKGEETVMTGNIGSVRYCAPEVLTADVQTEYNEKADVYSFGMILWEMVSRRRPFTELPPKRADIEEGLV